MALVSIFPTAEAAAAAVAERVLAKVSAEPDAVLGLATGQTPRKVYARMVEACGKGEVSFSSATTFNLDEYCGLPAAHPDSYAAYMQRELFHRTDFSPANINLIDGSAADEKSEASRYAALLRKQPVDIQLLGLGVNGHIGFNEPGSALASTVRVVELSEETLHANLPTLLVLDKVPERAITMGISDILRAREIIVLATGSAKADAVRRCLEEEQTADCPGSYLSGHPNVQWFVDQAAASKLRNGPRA
ncbi:glucosamine-6-phosphate deaminase [Neorhizobium sp. NPDC001467]|uniref:glucosamine-6-phosphate deaminase n=1 Tax=Neorhizobium sp. NPDC001467 TaxID=3390595 RepID=UPI003D010067